MDDMFRFNSVLGVLLLNRDGQLELLVTIFFRLSSVLEILLLSRDGQLEVLVTMCFVLTVFLRYSYLTEMVSICSTVCV